jgi:hypothetical protein
MYSQPYEPSAAAAQPFVPASYAQGFGHSGAGSTAEGGEEPAYVGGLQPWQQHGASSEGGGSYDAAEGDGSSPRVLSQHVAAAEFVPTAGRQAGAQQAEAEGVRALDSTAAEFRPTWGGA